MLTSLNILQSLDSAADSLEYDMITDHLPKTRHCSSCTRKTGLHHIGYGSLPANGVMREYVSEGRIKHQSTPFLLTGNALSAYNALLHSIICRMRSLIDEFLYLFLVKLKNMSCEVAVATGIVIIMIYCPILLMHLKMNNRKKSLTHLMI